MWRNKQRWSHGLHSYPTTNTSTHLPVLASRSARYERHILQHARCDHHASPAWVWMTQANLARLRCRSIHHISKMNGNRQYAERKHGRTVAKEELLDHIDKVRLNLRHVHVRKICQRTHDVGGRSSQSWGTHACPTLFLFSCCVNEPRRMTQMLSMKCVEGHWG